MIALAQFVSTIKIDAQAQWFRLYHDVKLETKVYKLLKDLMARKALLRALVNLPSDENNILSRKM
jgi:hypothetical protein